MKLSDHFQTADYHGLPQMGEDGGRGATALPETICGNLRQSAVQDAVRQSTGQGATADVIAGLIRQDNRIPAAKIAQSPGMVNRTVQRVLKTLQTEGRLKRIGGTRGTWLVMEDHA